MISKFDIQHNHRILNIHKTSLLNQNQLVMSMIFMKKILLIIIFLAATIATSISLAQSMRSLSGTITLDVGPSAIDRTLLVTVRNHSFVALPSGAILRPIISSRSTAVELPKQSSNINYSINDILTDAVDYSISIECTSCTNDFPLQFYAPDGNRLGLTNSTYIDPDELPDELDITAITRASISGEITLDRTAERDLGFRLTVVSSQNPAFIFQTSSPIRLSLGQRSTSYSVSGLNRAIGSDQYRLQLQCVNCMGASRQPQIFSSSLSPNENHSEINFMVTDEPFISIAPILNLLLE